MTKKSNLANVYTLAYSNKYSFEWDESKEARNYKKHGVQFHEAMTVWSDPHSIEYFDSRHSISEDRFIRIGASLKNRVLMVVFCERRNNVIRLISARIATVQEVKNYEERI